ncbi:aminotransferase class I/II-fold pyridoxal phosphate-dependent enzyme [Streptomyces anulatus]|uniref:aminotransferase class I/II-fold pyridoxal phosphate-dependent enzyme n=1 Tax=Streptomyces anulatus TaxID=1892 RepID=UPI0033DBE3DE
MTEVPAVRTRLAARKRRSRDDRVNLSSNELLHPAVDDLIPQLIADFRPSDLVRYPVQDEAAAAVAKLWGREPTEVLLAPGSDSVIRLLLSAVREAFGGRLVLQDPNYEAWRDASERIGGWTVQPVRKPGRSGADWLPQLTRAVEQAPAPCLIAVSWPNGPDGHVPEWQDLDTLLKVCRLHGHLLVLDGCYAGFCGAQDRLVERAGPHCMVLLSWSKMFGLAGGRLAAALGEPALVDHLRGYRQEDHVNALMLTALKASPELLPDFRRVWADVASSREGLRDWLRHRGFPSPPSGGNFLHIPLRHGRESAWLTQKLSERGYRVRDMQETPGLTHHVRFTAACGPVRTAFQTELEPLLDELSRATGAWDHD